MEAWHQYIASIYFRFVNRWLALLFLVPIASACRAIDVPNDGGWSKRVVFDMNTGNALVEENKFEDARLILDAAIRLDPTAWPAYYNRARVSAKQHKWGLVVQDCNSAIRLKPTFLRAAILRGNSYWHLGNYGRGLAELNKLLNLHPDADVLAHVLNDRAWLRVTCPDPSFRNGLQAVTDANRACFLTHHKKWDYVDTLAAAYAETGDFDAAVRWETRAMALAQGAEDINGAKRSLKMYQEHHAFRAILK